MNIFKASRSSFYSVSARSRTLPLSRSHLVPKPSMDAHRFYGSVLKKMKVESTPAKNALDDADILALEESFSDDSIEINEVRPVVKQSPVRARNKEFEDDFNSDFSDEEVVEIRPKKEVNDVQTKLSALVKEFSSPIDQSSQKIKISQLGNNINENLPLPKLTRIVDEGDFEGSFLEGDVDLPPKKEEARIPLIKPGSLDRTSSSIYFTSSPSYHKTETVYKRVPDIPNNLNPKQEEEPEIILDSFEDDYPMEDAVSPEEEQNTNQLYPNMPPLQSIPKTKELYPSMNVYNQKYQGPEGIVNSEERVSIPKVSTENLSNNDQMQQFFKPKFIPPSFKSEPKSIPNLLNRPKKRNAELLLLTQRPQTHDLDYDLQHARHASTTSRPKGDDVHHVKTVQPFSLSEEQHHIVDLAKQGNSLFYTGSAGTGKSVLLRSMIKTMKSMHPPETVHVTASTGLAACNIGGITLHSFAGIGLGKESAFDLIKKIKKSRKGRERWKSCKVLFIDEISMIDGKLFDKLDAIAKAMRRNDEPFGGIQVIVCGDFFQLPPVSKRDEEAALFCFDSQSWKECIKLTITLQKVFRQKGDMEFITMLNEMRLGKISERSVENFRKLERKLPQDDIEPAELYCTRYEVENANLLRLKQLKTQIKTYTAYDGGYLEDPDHRERLLSNFMAPSVLNLKKGAQVMMIKNIDDTLVNGSLGKILDFIDQETYLTYSDLRENNFMDNAEIEKAIEKVKFDPRAQSAEEGPHPVLEDTVFEFLNEIKSEDQEVLENIKMKKHLMKQLHESSRGKLLPLVKFLTPDGQSRTVLVQPETWEVEDEFDRPLVTRMQVPLILAWALSIHKSQGQTLPRVRVNLRRVFEKGQAYVALSRAVSREGLQVLFFDEKKVWAHPRVVEFYNNLKSAQDARLEAAGYNKESNKSMDLEQNDIAEAADHEVEFMSEEEDHKPEFRAKQEDQKSKSIQQQKKSTRKSFSEQEDAYLSQYVDAMSSPVESKFDPNNAPFMTQDESSDNIIVNRRTFRKRANEGW